MTIDTFLNRELWWLEGNRPYLLSSAPIWTTFSPAVCRDLKQRIREIGQTTTTPNNLSTALT
jgi:hypothetical protein